MSTPPKSAAPATLGQSRPRHAGPPRGGPVRVARGQRRSRPAPIADGSGAAANPTPELAELAALPEPPAVGAAPRGSGSGRVWIWSIVVFAVVALGLLGVLGFVRPAYLTTKVFDQAAVQHGVHTVLRQDYHLTEVADVVCPAGAKVQPASSFSCLAKVDGRTAVVPVIVQDQDGHYLVGRPA